MRKRHQSEDMLAWHLTGLLATLVIVGAFPIYYLKVVSPQLDRPKIETSIPATFVGTNKCKDCHEKTYAKWHDSHHDRAMEAADEDTVLGDFNDAVFESDGATSRFYRKNGRFFVYTRGTAGNPAEYEITHTFGWYPLQQYLVPFPGGRLQCLPIAWDVKQKKWYHLYPDQAHDPKDWLYWTNAGQNWNGMCAECHSTNLKKNYNFQNDTYQTTFSDIDVGCEACHGPGSRHVNWAQMPEMARLEAENYDLVVKTSQIKSREQVELCAPCHSRRAALGDYTHAESDLLDSLMPTLLVEGTYFADGQILEEVYVYGSFTQSKMYQRDVRCSDCHDVHSLKPIKTGNALCLQCHKADDYDTGAHHFHKKTGEAGQPIRAIGGEVLFQVGTGAECVGCHMPGRNYMGIDYRPDHSLRLPRPDLSAKIATPDACQRCHFDKSFQWSDETLTKWYGPGRKDHYGLTIDAGREGRSDAGDDLIRLAADPLYPVIVRATALSLLNAYPGKESSRAMELALIDNEALIRRTALENMRLSDLKSQIKLIAPLLYDPVKAVRMEAARLLAPTSFRQQLTSDQQKVLQTVLPEFERSMEYSADFAFGRYNLGNLYAALDQPDKAIDNFRAAFAIDALFYPAKVNLAMLYNQRGQKDQALTLLREVVGTQPELYEAAYSLGLLLAEMKNFSEAAIYLAKAAEGMPARARIHYNLGLLWQHQKKYDRAEAALLKAEQLEANNPDYLYALCDHYLKRKQFKKAKIMAEKMIAINPSQRLGHDLLNIIEKIMEHEQK
jgi:tetratricopeptide (TPR) repeat protein